VPSPYRVFLWVGPFIFANWLLVAVLKPDAGRGLTETVSIGFFLGTLFAHAALAAAWTALGPGPLVWRLPLSLVWIFLLAVAIQFNTVINGGPKGVALVVGACLFGEWLLLQIPLWTIALAFGAHLRHNTKAPAFDPRERQFGIRQLIIVTTIVAVVFGAGRLAVPQMAEHLELTKGEGPIFVFLGVAAVILALPLILAALMRQFALPSVLIVLILLAIGTASEVPLLRLVGGGGPGPKVQDFVAINFFTASVLLTVLSMVRLNGYSLTRSLSG